MMEERYVIVYYGRKYEYVYGETKEVIVPIHESRPLALDQPKIIRDYAPKHMNYCYARIEQRYYTNEYLKREREEFLNINKK